MLEWGLQALLVLALAASLPVAVRLERTLSSLGSQRADLAASAKAFVAAVQDAESAIARLRQASESVGRDVGQQIALAERTGDDLRALLQRAEGEADRLEIVVRDVRAVPARARAEPKRGVRQAASPVEEPPAAARAVAPAAPAAVPAAALARAAAEQEVLRAIRGERTL
jgi:hypothetical protein